MRRWTTIDLFFLFFASIISAADASLLDLLFSRQPRIVGGVPSRGIPAFGSPARNPVCGCTLIYEDVALTAAHCRGSFLGQTIFFGGTHVDGEDALDAAVAIAEYPYPLFDYHAQRHDIMLIQLDRPLRNVVPAKWNTNQLAPADASIVRTLGFGDTHPYRGRPSDVLLEIAVPVVNTNDCNSPEAYNNMIDAATMICAGSQQQDSCNGDSGNPLLLDDTVVGVVSFGVECGGANHPGIYTRVSAYDAYIRSGICTLSLNPPCVCDGSCPVTTTTTTTDVPDLVAIDDDDEEEEEVEDRTVNLGPPPTTLAPQASPPTTDAPQPPPPPLLNTDPGIILEPILTSDVEPTAAPIDITATTSSSWTRRCSCSGAWITTALASFLLLFASSG